MTRWSGAVWWSWLLVLGFLGSGMAANFVLWTTDPAPGTVAARGVEVRFMLHVLVSLWLWGPLMLLDKAMRAPR